MTQLETAVALLIQTFDTYAAADGCRDTLSKAEAKTLLQKELPGLLKAPKNPGDAEKFMNELDINGDSVVDFTEFVVMVCGLACLCHGRCCKK